MKNNRPQTSKMQKSSSMMGTVAGGQGLRGNQQTMAGSQGQRMQRQISAAGQTSATGFNRGPTQGIGGRVASATGVGGTGPRSHFQKQKTLKVTALTGDGTTQIGSGTQVSQVRSVSESAKNERPDQNSWINSHMGVGRVTEISREIEKMLTKPSSSAAGANQKDQIENFSSQAHSVGSYIYKCLSNQRKDAKSSAKDQTPYETCWCHFSGIQEETIPLQKQLKRAAGDADCAESTLDMRCIYDRGSTSVKVVTAGGQEFVVPMEMAVEKVWPIEDGIIIQAISQGLDGFSRSRPDRSTSPHDLHHSIPASIHMGMSQHRGAPANTRTPATSGLDSQPSFTYLSLTQHPLNDLHPVRLNVPQQGTNQLLIQTHDNILYTSPVFPFVVIQNCQQSQLKFALINKMPQKQKVPADEYILSLMPSSRHSLLPLSPKQPELQLDVIWGITSTQAPTTLTVIDDPLASGGSRGVAPSTRLSDLVIPIFYSSEQQLAFIKFNLTTMQVAPAFVLKDVAHFAKIDNGGSRGQSSRLLFEFSRETMSQKQEWAQYMEEVSKKVEGLGSAIALVERKSENEVQIYRGTVRLASFTMEGSVTALREAPNGDGGLEVTYQLNSDSGKVEEKKRLLRFDPLALGGLDSTCSATSAIVKVLSQTLPASVYSSIHQDIIVQKSQTAHSDFQIVSSLLLSWLKHEELWSEQATGHFRMKRQSLKEERTGKIDSGSVSATNFSSNTSQTKATKATGRNNTGVDSGQAFKLLKSHAKLNNNRLKGLFSQQLMTKLSNEPADQSRQHLSGPQFGTLDGEFIVTATNPKLIQPYFEHLFTLLHYLHEDLLITNLNKSIAVQLSKLLCKWVLCLPERDGLAKASYFWYYVSQHRLGEFTDEAKAYFGSQLQDLKPQSLAVSLQQVPILRQTLRLIKDNKVARQPYIVLFEATRSAIKQAQRTAETKYDTLVTENIVHAAISSSSDDQSLPAILRQPNLLFPSLNILKSRCHQPDQFAPDRFQEDCSGVAGGFATLYQHPDRAQIGPVSANLSKENGKLVGSESAQAQNSERDAIIQVKMKIEQFATQDSRMREVTNFLSSEHKMSLKMTKIANFQSLQEEEQKERKQKALEKAYMRQLSKMVGRGLLQFGTKDTISTERLVFKKINQQGVCGADEAPISLEIKDDDEVVQWPLFHNGAAEAIKFLLSLQDQKQKQIHFARNWIMQHKPNSPKADHAGFLLALGLFGLLDSLVRTDIYQHLKSMHDATVIAILLGKSASQKGEMDQQFTKTLCVHISYLQPPSVSADISLPVQSAAMIGAALQYLGSQNRPITEMLLTQIGRKPINDRAVEREVYALSAGIALGFVNLGAGPHLGQLFGDLNIDERLIRFIEGGKIMDIPKSMLQANQNAESHQCSSIREGDQINIHITSAGGLFALTLIYLQTGCHSVCQRLQMPETFNQLEYVRPPFLLQKTLSRNLIMWNGIEASKAWVERQIPEIIKFSFENSMHEVEKRYHQQISGERCDFATIALCHAYISTGAYLSIAYKYAGTCDPVAFELINSYIKTLRKAKTATQQSPELLHQIYTDHTKNLIDKHTLENCLCTLSLALSLIMAGSCDVGAFRTLRAVRKRVEGEMHYGHNLAINMAIGLLFMGSGAYSCSTEHQGERVRRPTSGPFDMTNRFTVASLLCSFFPIFPKDPSDNRHHLQALRHFWLMVVRSPVEILQMQQRVEAMSIGTKQMDQLGGQKGVPGAEEQPPKKQIETSNHLEEVVYNLPDEVRNNLKVLNKCFAEDVNDLAQQDCPELQKKVAGVCEMNGQTDKIAGQKSSTAVNGPPEQKNNTIQSLFLDTQHVHQTETMLQQTLSSLVGGDGVLEQDAKEHVFLLLKQCHVPSSLQAKLSWLSKPEGSERSLSLTNNIDKSLQLAHIQAIRHYNLCHSSSEQLAPVLSPNLIQVMHLLVVQMLGQGVPDKTLSDFKSYLYLRVAQLTREETAQIGVALGATAMHTDANQQLNSGYTEMLKCLQDIVDAAMEEEHCHDLSAEHSFETLDKATWSNFVLKVVLPGLMAI